MTTAENDLRNEMTTLANAPAGVWTGLNCYECMSEIDEDADTECDCTEAVRFNPLGVEFTVTGEGRIIGVTVLVDTGGPHIELKAREGSNLSFVGTSWFSEPVTCYTSEPSDDVLDFYGQTMDGVKITT